LNNDPNIKSGYDLLIKNCPTCQTPLINEGHQIPFATFAGFDFEKMPDIDLNFSGEYQIQAHNFLRDLFGENHVFRIGTISTIALQTAKLYVTNYAKEKNLTLSTPEIEKLAHQLQNNRIKRTSGQHPGGLLIIPREYEVYDFTPLNFPADDKQSN
jgi:DNA polymerase-3 subunit alpha (Gram-positive type)